MIYTLDRARREVRKFVDNGSCSTEVIDARINEAMERLTDHADFECMRAITRIRVEDLAFPLPWNAEKIISVAVDGTAGRVFAQPYQFLSSGPGDLDYKNGCMPWPDILDQGEFPIMYDIPKCIEWQGQYIDLGCVGMKLLALSTAQEDVGKFLRIEGHLVDGCEVVASPSGFGQGELVPINYWKEGEIDLNDLEGLKLSQNLFADISSVVKGDTVGYVTLYAVFFKRNLSEIAVPTAQPEKVTTPPAPEQRSFVPFSAPVEPRSPFANKEDETRATWCLNNLTFTVSPGGVLSSVSGTLPPDGVLVVPPEVSGTTITAFAGISDTAFAATVKRITLPAGVVEVKPFAFTADWSSLTEVVALGVTHLSGPAFVGCPELTTLILPELLELGFTWDPGRPSHGNPANEALNNLPKLNFLWVPQLQYVGILEYLNHLAAPEVQTYINAEGFAGVVDGYRREAPVLSNTVYPFLNVLGTSFELWEDTPETGNHFTNMRAVATLVNWDVFPGPFVAFTRPGLASYEDSLFNLLPFWVRPGLVGVESSDDHSTISRDGVITLRTTSPYNFDASETATLTLLGTDITYDGSYAIDHKATGLRGVTRYRNTLHRQELIVPFYNLFEEGGMPLSEYDGPKYVEMDPPGEEPPAGFPPSGDFSFRETPAPGIYSIVASLPEEEVEAKVHIRVLPTPVVQARTGVAVAEYSAGGQAQVDLMPFLRHYGKPITELPMYTIIGVKAPMDEALEGCSIAPGFTTLTLPEGLPVGTYSITYWMEFWEQYSEAEMLIEVVPSLYQVVAGVAGSLPVIGSGGSSEGGGAVSLRPGGSFQVKLTALTAAPSGGVSGTMTLSAADDEVTVNWLITEGSTTATYNISLNPTLGAGESVPVGFSVEVETSDWSAGDAESLVWYSIPLPDPDSDPDSDPDPGNGDANDNGGNAVETAVLTQIGSPIFHFSFLAKYHPRQEVPMFRRYALIGRSPTNEECPRNILALVRLRTVPLSHPDDIVPIDSLQALKLMVMAITEENKLNIQGALTLEAQALAVLTRRERARVQQDGMPTILNVDYRGSLGRGMNTGRLVL